MASKWAFLQTIKDAVTGRPKFPPLPEDSDYQQKINAVKDALRTRVASGVAKGEAASDHAAIVAMFEAAYDEKDRLEEATSANNLEIAALEQMLRVSMETQGVQDGFKSERFTYFPQPSPYPKVDDKAKLLAWVKESGQEELLSLNYQTLRGIVAEALGPNGSRVIPDGVTVFVKESISRRKR